MQIEYNVIHVSLNLFKKLMIKMKKKKVPVAIGCIFDYVPYVIITNKYVARLASSYSLNVHVHVPVKCLFDD